MATPFNPVKWAIVAFILAIVALVVVGNLSAQQRTAQRAAEMRNLQQWGIALNLYLIENDNQLPDVGTTPVTIEQQRAWFNVLPPYISERPLADIPAGSRPRPGVPSLWIRPGGKPAKIWDPEVFYFEYGMNRYLQPQEGVRSFRIHEINFPGNVIFLVPVAGYVPSSDPETIVLPKRRNASVPILYCDGHVQAVPAPDLTSDAALAPPTGGPGPSWFKP